MPGGSSARDACTKEPEPAAVQAEAAPTGAVIRGAAVHASQRVFSVEQVQVIGGGGTDMRVGIAAAEAQRPRADLLIVISDAETPWPAEKPKIPKIVLVNVGTHPPPDWPCRHIRVEVDR